MSKLAIAMLVGIALLVGLVAFRLYLGPRWRVLHQQVVGAVVLTYGAYLSLLTGTVTQLVVPGIGAIGAGAVTGGAIGLVTYAVLGVVGVATGGTAFALSAWWMLLIGAGVGSAGSAAGGFGFRTVSVPLVSPIFWGPLLVLGVYWLIGSRLKKRRSKAL